MTEAFQTFICDPDRCALAAARIRLQELRADVPEGSQSVVGSVVRQPGSSDCFQEQRLPGACGGIFRAGVKYTPPQTHR